jgi:hypothetical protein
MFVVELRRGPKVMGYIEKSVGIEERQAVQITKAQEDACRFDTVDQAMEMLDDIQEFMMDLGPVPVIVEIAQPH